MSLVTSFPVPLSNRLDCSILPPIYLQNPFLLPFAAFANFTLTWTLVCWAQSLTGWVLSFVLHSISSTIPLLPFCTCGQPGCCYLSMPSFCHTCSMFSTSQRTAFLLLKRVNLRSAIFHRLICPFTGSCQASLWTSSNLCCNHAVCFPIFSQCINCITS